MVHRQPAEEPVDLVLVVHDGQIEFTAELVARCFIGKVQHEAAIRPVLRQCDHLRPAGVDQVVVQLSVQMPIDRPQQVVEQQLHEADEDAVRDPDQCKHQRNGEFECGHRWRSMGGLLGGDQWR